MIETVGGSANCLAPGVQVGEYRLLDVIGEGGFGIVYRARDVSLDRIVAIKEYMPATLAGRKSSNEIHVRSQHRGAFDAGLRSFINEARLLAKFSHPALVHVYRFFESNGTAYMVMRHYEGQTFRAFLSGQQGRLGQRTLTAIISPVLDVVEMLHAADCYHRDIAPDNVFLQNSGMPVLLDFGAARRIIGDMTQALTMVLKPGFAPIEQYVDDGAMPQGAWTDIYQMGAMLYLAITGKPPATSVARMINDPVALLTPSQYPGFSAQFLNGVHRALAVKPQDRPQTIAELKEILGVTTMTSPVFAPWASAGVLAPAVARPTELDGGSHGRVDRAAAQLDGMHAHGLLGRDDAPEVAAVASLSQTGPIDAPPLQTQAAQPQAFGGAAASLATNTAAPLSLMSDEVFSFSSPPPSPITSPERLDTAGAQPATQAERPKPAAPREGVVFPAPDALKRPAPEAPDAMRQPVRTSAPAARWIPVGLIAAGAIVAAAWWGSRAQPSSPPPVASSAISSDDIQWQQAQEAGTVAALDAYLESNPAGAYRNQALALINRLEVAVPAAPASNASTAPRSTGPDQSTATETAPKLAASPAPTVPAPVGTQADPVPVEKPAAKPMGNTGRVVLRVSPWGRISVNGSAQGTTPPLTQLELPEGSHRIEITNPAAAPAVRTVQVKKGEPVVLSHQFE
ncbi:protein kinase domain-containing protein [Paracidovorax sp. MALMAid1276]|uniref:protein kinase domain-containing protein n=1 Tax=Paracidovorax sp. MALMAid1276 TaxID=3411631 RepID=UPI003B9BF134